MRSFPRSSSHASRSGAVARAGSRWCPITAGTLIVLGTTTPASVAVAQPDDEEADIKPPPGTPGSTAADEPIKPPSGTPGSTAQQPSDVTPPRPVSGEAPRDEQDDIDVHVSSKTYMRMFRRRYLGGFLAPGTEDETLVPLYEYASLRVQRIDAPWSRDAVELRLAAWGSADFADVSEERRLTGDLMEASVSSRFGSAHVTLGRQLTHGGPSLVTRFDGVAFGVHDDSGFGVDGYGGFTVRPRFRQRREYVLLGSATDSMLRAPNAVPDTSLTDGWVAGGRVSYEVAQRLDAGVSFHERHERGALDRRWGGADARVAASDELVLGGERILDLDGGHVVEVRGWADVEPVERLTTTAEVLHTSPALFLPRGSVLSVFSLDTVTEAGAEVAYALTPIWTVSVSGYSQWFSGGEDGYRVGGGSRFRFSKSLTAQMRYARVAEEELGYHTVRGSVSLDLAPGWRATTALQHYLYDVAIRGVDASSYGSATLEYGPRGQVWRVMLGGFATRSPYATYESEGIARLSVDLDSAGKGEP